MLDTDKSGCVSRSEFTATFDRISHAIENRKEKELSHNFGDGEGDFGADEGIF